MVSQEIIDKVKDYMLKNCLGKKNAISRFVIAETLKIHEKDLKKAIKAINEDEKNNIVISNTHRVYVCETKEEIAEITEKIVAEILTLLEKASILDDKFDRFESEKI